MRIDPPTKPQTLPLHFDTFGGVQHVCDSIDKFVPIIFKGEDIAFIPSLKETIRIHAAANKWNMVVLSLSKGMARQELDIVLNHVPDHVGPLIIDATARTPEHDVIYNETLLLARKERIIRLNNETSDIMVVLYGVHGIDPPMERKLLMKRFHYMGVTLDMLIERDDLVEGGSAEEGLTGRLQKALWYIRNIITENALHPDDKTHSEGMPIASGVLLSLASILSAFAMTQDEHLIAALNGVVQSFTTLPENFKSLESEFQPLLQAADVLQNKPDTHDEAHRPEVTNLLENHPSAIRDFPNTPTELNEVLNNANTMNNLENTPGAPLLVNNPVIKEKVAQELKHHHYDQLGPKMGPN